MVRSRVRVVCIGPRSNVTIWYLTLSCVKMQMPIELPAVTEQLMCTVILAQTLAPVHSGARTDALGQLNWLLEK